MSVQTAADPGIDDTIPRFTLRDRSPHPEPPGLPARLSDSIAGVVGSWTFIIAQSTLLVAWMVLNVTAWIQHWDPYPFILLNLVLSFQAAFTAPVLLMSQNRQSDIDRHKAQLDYDVNLKAELDIEALHQKVDLLREQDIGKLIRLVEVLNRERMEDEQRRAETTKEP